jgi:uncharacterized membrane protein YfcA
VSLDPASVSAGTTALLAGVAFVAGFVDAVAGGGGLIQLPPLLAVVGPDVAPGVNKVSSVCGTSAAIVRYAREGHVRWDRLRIALPLAFAASMAGTLGYLEALAHAKSIVTPVFAACFLALAVHQVLRVVRRRPEPVRPRVSRPGLGLAAIAGIGLYDGFVGPGTGLFLFWAFTTYFALPALDATGTTKAVNGATNVGALVVFVTKGAILWSLALPMAAANLAGGWLGAHTAIRRGVAFIRITTAVVCAGASVYLLVR